MYYFRAYEYFMYIIFTQYFLCQSIKPFSKREIILSLISIANIMFAPFAHFAFGTRIRIASKTSPCGICYVGPHFIDNRLKSIKS